MCTTLLDFDQDKCLLHYLSGDHNKGSPSAKRNSTGCGIVQRIPVEWCLSPVRRTLPSSMSPTKFFILSYSKFKSIWLGQLAMGQACTHNSTESIQSHRKQQHHHSHPSKETHVTFLSVDTPPTAFTLWSWGGVIVVGSGWVLRVVGCGIRAACCSRTGPSSRLFPIYTTNAVSHSLCVCSSSSLTRHIVRLGSSEIRKTKAMRCALICFAYWAVKINCLPAVVHIFNVTTHSFLSKCSLNSAHFRRTQPSLSISTF